MYSTEKSVTKGLPYAQRNAYPHLLSLRISLRQKAVTKVQEGSGTGQKLSISPQYFSLTTQQLGRDTSHGHKRPEGL
jgi:hypothetical protein